MHRLPLRHSGFTGPIVRGDRIRRRWGQLIGFQQLRFRNRFPEGLIPGAAGLLLRAVRGDGRIVFQGGIQDAEGGLPLLDDTEPQARLLTDIGFRAVPLQLAGQFLDLLLLGQDGFLGACDLRPLLEVVAQRDRHGDEDEQHHHRQGHHPHRTEPERRASSGNSLRCTISAGDRNNAPVGFLLLRHNQRS
ncbi:hypothetical protein [Corynebacterium efficiens YS-314]|uniref:Uncharacterized protein n=1 Tax=Corynebacterium efficiens (strain DSM 44549 / YS-314 / AJ 12310 / JCM 11189 / NBRC 100395) TaxID=196164 RepID=Q8FQS6_COREF|nr:hypothetical protein [Corynebacterium efficiens YS-314]